MHYTSIIRNRDFIAACRRHAAAWDVEKDGVPTVDKIIDRVIKGRAPRFYVGYEQAYRHVCSHLKSRRQGREPVITDPMWAAFQKAIDMEMSRHSISAAQAVVNVIDNYDAPSYYISHATARHLYFDLRRSKKLTTKN